MLNITLKFTSLLAGASIFIGASCAAKVRRDDFWGGSVSLGPTKSHIINAVTTLIPGPNPEDQNGELFLWPGMSNGTGDLIQTTLESWPGTGGSGDAWCGATGNQWCVRASLFGSFGQLDGEGGIVNPTDHVKIVYNLEPNGQNWTQTVTNALTGAALSSFNHVSGPMTGYGTGTECDDNCNGTTQEQQYLNTTITLAGSDSTFGATIATAGGATYTGLSSNEDHTVWTIDTILIPAMD